jgi:hypothetical protein
VGGIATVGGRNNAGAVTRRTSGSEVNPKSESRSPKQIQMKQIRKGQTAAVRRFPSIADSIFEIVSDFGFRISNFPTDV